MKNTTKKLLGVLIIATCFFVGAKQTLAAPYYSFSNTILPSKNNATDLGTSTSVSGSVRWLRNIFLRGNLTNDQMTNGCASWSSGILTSLGVPCGSGSGGGSGGGTWSTTTSSVTNRFINYPNNTSDIPCIGGTATTTCKTYFDPNTNINQFNGIVSIGNSVAPQLTGFGTNGGKYQLHFSTSTNDVAGADFYNIDPGPQAAIGLFFQNNKSPLGGIGLGQTYYGGLIYSGGGWNGAALGVGALPANSVGLYATDGALVLGSATSTGHIDFITGPSSFSSGAVDATLLNNGNFGIGTTSPYARLSVTNATISTGPAFAISTSTLTATSTALTVDSNGFVGIGTSTPASALSIFNDQGINFTRATSTFNGTQGGINIKSGCFAINGTCTGLGSGSGSVTSVTLATPNSSLSLGGTNPVTTSGTINADINVNHANFYTALQNFTFATTSTFGATSTVYLTGVGSAGGLGIDSNGKVYSGATSTLSTISGSLNLASQVTGTLPVANGGTGNTTFTGGNLLYGNGTGSIGSIATTTVTCAGTVACTTFTTLGGTPITLTGSGGAGTYPFTPTTNFGANTNATTGVVWFQNGLQASTTSWFDNATTTSLGVRGVPYFTGVGSAGGLAVDGNGKVYSGATSTLSTISGLLAPSQISGGSTNTVLLQNGIDVKGWAKVGLSTMVTGTLPVANGGTDRTTFNGSELLYGNGTGSLGTIATTSVTCSGSQTCSTFNVIGASPITLGNTYLFPNNATSTQLTFSAGFIGTNGSTTNFVATSTLGVATSTPGTPLGVTGAGTFTGQVEALNFYATSTTATSTFLGQISGNRVTAATARFTGLVSCDTIDSDLYGNLVCGTDATGAGGSVTGNGIAGMMAAWTSGSNLVGTSTILAERFVATSTTAASSTIPNLGLTNLSVSGNAEIGVPRYPWLSGMLLSVDSTGLTEATGTPTAGFFNATSTTASSTFQGLESNLLHVRSTTASSTFENGINLTKGCFAINGVCTGLGSGSGTVTSVATNNGLTGGTITTTGTLGFDLSKLGTTNQNSLLVWNGSQLQATGTTVTVGNLVATTTATSTLGGGLAVTGYTALNATTTAKMIYCPEYAITPTSTSMTVNWGDSCSQLLGIGTSAITIASFNAANPGQPLSLTVCNPSSGTAGTITWPSNVSWPGGVAPGQTTTAGQCDVWNFKLSNGTSTPTVGSAKYLLTGLTSGYQ